MCIQKALDRHITAAFKKVAFFSYELLLSVCEKIDSSTDLKKNCRLFYFTLNKTSLYSHRNRRQFRSADIFR